MHSNNQVAETTSRHLSYDNNILSLPNPQMQNQYNPLLPYHHQNPFNIHLLNQQQSQMITNRHFCPTNTSTNQYLTQCPQLQQEALSGLANNNNGDFAHLEVGLPHKFIPKICRQTQQYSTAKQPFWCADAEMEGVVSNTDKEMGQMGDVARENNQNNNIWLYGELEAIYGLNATNIVEQPNIQRKKLTKRRRKRKQLVLSSMSRFFERLVESVMSHQHRLHSDFMEAMDRIDRERSQREQSRPRQEEALLFIKEEKAAMASESDIRDTLIVSYLDKIASFQSEKDLV